MNTHCNCNNECGCNECKPAKYSCDFNIQANPYNPHEWFVTMNGMSHKVSVPDIAETDTKLSTDSSNATLNYKAERHQDTLTGEQLGGLIDLGNLRDVAFDPNFTGTCSELIYRKFTDCGEGCTSPADRWSDFNINSNGAKQDFFRYIRGANAYGCPVYLDAPTDDDEFWFAGWRTNGEHKEFGYFQAQQVGELPQDEDGNPIVMSISPENGKPVVGSLPFQKSIDNIVAGLGMNVYGTFSVIQQTPNFGANLNSVTGDFVIHWSDWWNSDLSRHVGDGRITGKLIWTPRFNTNNGKMYYHVTGIYFNTMSFTTDQGFPTTQNVYITVKGVQLGTGAETTVVNRYEHHGNTSWSHTINQTIPCNYTIECAPNTTVGPLNFAYIFNDTSILDDEGYLQANFQNKLPGWEV